MKFARYAVLGIALTAGVIAARLVSNSAKPVQVETLKPEPPRFVDVLVARRDIPAGTSLSEADFQWQEWPSDHANGRYVKRSGTNDVARQLTGSISRIGLVQGEPLRREALIDPNQTSYMAALLKPGMRAVSAEISPATGAGGFILPNDRVDVILVGNDKRTGGDGYWSKTVLTNVRVLAIDQSLKEGAGHRAVVGKIATFELNGEDAETLSLAKRLGTIFLALRSVDDNGRTDETLGDDRRSETVSFLRLGKEMAR
jgi:pilus assembly protein CpaB